MRELGCHSQAKVQTYELCKDTTQFFINQHKRKQTAFQTDNGRIWSSYLWIINFMIEYTYLPI